MLGHWVPGVKKEEEDTRHDQREERQLMVCAWRLHPNTRNQAKGMLEVLRLAHVNSEFESRVSVRPSNIPSGLQAGRRDLILTSAFGRPTQGNVDRSPRKTSKNTFPLPRFYGARAPVPELEL